MHVVAIASTRSERFRVYRCSLLVLSAVPATRFAQHLSCEVNRSTLVSFVSLASCCPFSRLLLLVGSMSYFGSCFGWLRCQLFHMVSNFKPAECLPQFVPHIVCDGTADEALQGTPRSFRIVAKAAKAAAMVDSGVVCCSRCHRGSHHKQSVSFLLALSP